MPCFFNIDMEKFSEIINGDTVTLVDFFAEWCGPCKAMRPVLEQVKKELGDGVRIIKIDVDRNEPLSRRFNIASVPTLMIFRRGEMLWRGSGVRSAADLVAAIKSV